LPWSSAFVRLWLHNNLLAGTIPLGLASKSYNGGLTLQNNRFLFKDLVPFLDAKADISDVTYAPQRKFGSSSTINRSVGQSVTMDNFDSVVTHSNNQYQWEKDGTPISGATSRTFSKSNLQTSDSGNYVLKVTNAGAPALTLESQTITLNVS